MFSGGIERDKWYEMDLRDYLYLAFLLQTLRSYLPMHYLVNKIFLSNKFLSFFIYLTLTFVSHFFDK